MVDRDRRFQVGDRVRILKEIWKGHQYATIVGSFRPLTPGAGRDRGDNTAGAWPINLDDYDYRLDQNPGNCHTIADTAIELVEPTDEEIRALFFPHEAQGGPR